MPDGVLVADADGRVTTLNRPGRRLLGISGDGAVGRDFREVLALDDLDRTEWWHCVDPYRGLRTRSGHPEQLLELRTGPYAGRELFVASRYVRDTRGGPLVRLVVSFRDSRARRRADRERADLVSTVAHEIRSPLTTVKGFTATLLAKWDRLSEEQKRAMLEAVDADADRVTRLLSDLLDVSRIDAGRLRLRLQLVDVPAAVRQVFAGRVAAGDPVRYEDEVTGEQPERCLRTGRVAQVLGNLVENAVRHGAGTVAVEVAAAKTEAGDPAVQLTVADEGEGIDDDVRSRIFSRFWRGGHAAGGSGLGLYIVKGIVEAHHGTVEVDGASGGGALFRVLLPAGRPPWDTPGADRP